MSNIKYINANEFIEMLKLQGLVIVSASEFEASNQLRRKKLMKRKSLSLSEIVKAGIFPIKTTKSLLHWIENEKIKPGEWYQEQEGRKRMMISTEAIKRLGYED